jgi:hypothetical protein
MVGDSLNGVQLERGRPTTCVKQCNDLFALLFKLEQKRHDAANDICQNSVPQADKAACLAAEDANHQANKAALTQAKTDCQNNCHRQGSGSAG